MPRRISSGNRSSGGRETGEASRTYVRKGPHTLRGGEGGLSGRWQESLGHRVLDVRHSQAGTAIARFRPSRDPRRVCGPSLTVWFQHLTRSTAAIGRDCARVDALGAVGYDLRPTKRDGHARLRHAAPVLASAVRATRAFDPATPLGPTRPESGVATRGCTRESPCQVP